MSGLICQTRDKAAPRRGQTHRAEGKRTAQRANAPRRGQTHRAEGKRTAQRVNAPRRGQTHRAEGKCTTNSYVPVNGGRILRQRCRTTGWLHGQTAAARVREQGSVFSLTINDLEWPVVQETLLDFLDILNFSFYSLRLHLPARYVTQCVMCTTDNTDATIGSMVNLSIAQRPHSINGLGGGLCVQTIEALPQCRTRISAANPRAILQT